MRAIRSRLLCFLFLLFVVNLLDRINLGFAALRMNKDLGFDAQVFGLGAGVFFIGYLLFEIPSNFLLRHFGARIWLARIAISWGIVAVAMALVYDATSFYVVRFLLGVAEAGFAPGVNYFVMQWVPRRHLGVAIVTFALAIPVAAILGAPLSGWLLTLGSPGGLAGWQWMFIAEGLPSIVLGLLALRILTDRPDQATWLDGEQRAWLTSELSKETAQTAAHGISGFGAAARNGRVWLMAAGFFCVTMTTYGMSYWLPQIIKEFSGLSDFAVSLLTAIPFIGLGAGMILNAWLSDRHDERRFHFAGAAIIGAAGIMLACVTSNPWAIFLGVSICSFGLGGALATFWPIPMSLLTGSAAVGGIALINMVGNSAGFVGSYLIGWIRQSSASFSGAFAMLAGLFLLGAILIVCLGPLPGSQRRPGSLPG